MARKVLSGVLVAIILSLCCGFCFAAEENTSINLGNEIKQSIDKTGNSVGNVVSGNVINDASNQLKDGANNIKNTMENVGNDIKGGANNVKNTVENGTENIGNNTREAVDGVIADNSIGNYNTTRTTTEGTVTNTDTMTTTTWMWIILVVAAITIIAAIWYYATQNND